MIKNNTEFNQAFSGVAAQALDFVMQKVLTEYRDIIDSVVYGAGQPNPIMGYDRTGEFKDSWVVKTEQNTDGATGYLEQDIAIMQYEPSIYQHGSLENGDVRDALAQIIYEGLSGDLFGRGYWQQPRDAWTPLVQVLDKGKLNSWFIEGMSQQGFQIRKQGAGRPSQLW